MLKLTFTYINLDRPVYYNYTNNCMSLFIGNVSKQIANKQFQDAFKSYGNCKIDLRNRYAFIQFESERCAEQAREGLQNANFSGLRLNIEWSKNSGRFNENRNARGGDRGGRRRRSNSRERSWRRDDRNLRRSPDHQKRNTPSYSENEDDIENFEPKCPRDAELLKRLKERREEGEMIDNHRHSKMELEAGEAV